MGGVRGSWGEGRILSGAFRKFPRVDVFYGIQGKVSIWVFGGLVISPGCPRCLTQEQYDEGMSRGSEEFHLNQILTRLVSSREAIRRM